MSEIQKYNRFTFAPDDYKKPGVHTGLFPDEDEVKWDEMWKDCASFVRLAIKNSYQCHVWHDGYTLVVDYNYLDESIAGATLEWVGENEYVESYNKPEEEEEDPVPIRKDVIPVSWVENQDDKGKWQELVRRWDEYISRVPDEMRDDANGPTFEWDYGKDNVT